MILQFRNPGCAETSEPRVVEEEKLHELHLDGVTGPTDWNSATRACHLWLIPPQPSISFFRSEVIGGDIYVLFFSFFNWKKK